MSVFIAGNIEESEVIEIVDEVVNVLNLTERMVDKDMITRL